MQFHVAIIAFIPFTSLDYILKYIYQLLYIFLSSIFKTLCFFGGKKVNELYIIMIVWT